MYPPLVSFQCKAENPGIIGKTIQQINPDRRFQTNFSRILRDNVIYIASPSFVIEKGDIIRLVGPASEQSILEQMIGKASMEWIDKKSKASTRCACYGSTRDRETIAGTSLFCQTWCCSNENYT